MEKSRDGKSQRREEKKKKRSEEKKSQKKDYAGVHKGIEKLRSYVFPMFCGSGGSKSRYGRLAKVAGAEPSGEMRDGKLHAAVSRTDFEVKKLKAFHARSTLES